MSPRLVLDYKVNPDIMWFGSLAKGYKAGGYNSVEVGSQFDNEDVWNVEAGIKSVFPNADVVLNASAFYYVYDNKQAISLVTRRRRDPTSRSTWSTPATNRRGASTSMRNGRPPTTSRCTPTSSTSTRPTRTR